MILRLQMSPLFSWLPALSSAQSLLVGEKRKMKEERDPVGQEGATHFPAKLWLSLSTSMLMVKRAEPSRWL
jgi:hypothetical protein